VDTWQRIRQGHALQDESPTPPQEVGEGYPDREKDMIAYPIEESPAGIGRGHFWVAWIALNICFAVLDTMMTDLDTGLYYESAIGGALIMVSAYIWASIWLGMQRAIDIGINKWHGLWTLIPLGAIVLGCRRSRKPVILQVLE